jgi:hypothetical protein
MRRIDSPCLTHDPLAATSTVGSGLSPLESSGPFPVDVADAPGPSWESAWIDLGGEG